jgi:hypothetical protein
MKNWFTELSAIDVSSHVKQKNGLNYLSWMWAWSELKKRYPLSYSTVHETEDGLLVWKDPIGCHVKTSVTIVWEDEDGTVREHTVTEYLPCMDFKNKAVAYENVDSMLVNKTIQRSLTKCIARLGIGGYLFASEDLPEDVTKAVQLQAEIIELIKKKCALGDAAKTKVGEIAKEAEKEFDPSLEDDMVTGNPRNIDNIEILEKLKKKLLAVRR